MALSILPRLGCDLKQVKDVPSRKLPKGAVVGVAEAVMEAAKDIEADKPDTGGTDE